MYQLTTGYLFIQLKYSILYENNVDYCNRAFMVKKKVFTFVCYHLIIYILNGTYTWKSRRSNVCNSQIPFYVYTLVILLRII